MTSWTGGCTRPFRGARKHFLPSSCDTQSAQCMYRMWPLPLSPSLHVLVPPRVLREGYEVNRMFHMKLFHHHHDHKGMWTDRSPFS